VFTAEERDGVRERVVELAEADSRVVAAAVVGSLALGGGDRWSDLDLTFGVAEDARVEDVLGDWTSTMAAEFEAVQLLDLVVRGTTYRVFLLPRLLQVDLSFAPASQFRQGSPRFKLLFGDHKIDYPPPPSAANLFGWGVVYARHAHVCIERGRPWEAEHAVSGLRDTSFTLACLRRDLPTSYAKGFDALPPDVLDRFGGALVRSLDSAELRRALAAGIDCLLREGGDAGDVVGAVEPQLRELASVG
jgi:hypothetical protein